MVGELDMLSLPQDVHELALALRRRPDVTTTSTTAPIVVVVVSQVGHAVPMEAPQIWRDDVQTFLSVSNETTR